MNASHKLLSAMGVVPEKDEESHFEVHVEEKTIISWRSLHEIANFALLHLEGLEDRAEIEDQALVDLWNAFEEIDPSEEHLLAHLRSVLLSKTNFFDLDDPVIGEEG